MSGPTDEPAARKPWVAGVAMALAGGGILVSVLGQRLGRPFLEERAGPALTLLGAAVWIGFRIVRRRR